MKYVPCTTCGLNDVAVRDDFDEDVDAELCWECWEQFQRELDDEQADP